MLPDAALPLVCWSAKLIHIGEVSRTWLANDSPFCCATFLGRPRCWNISRLEVKLNNCVRIDGTTLPWSTLEPRSQLRMSLRTVVESLRRVSSTWLLSSRSGTLNFRLVTPLPDTTSVGDGVARSRAKRPLPSLSRGIAEATSEAGNRLKYCTL